MAYVAKRTFTPRDDLYMLYVVYDEAIADFGPVWLVPSKALAELGGDGAHRKSPEMLIEIHHP